MRSERTLPNGTKLAWASTPRRSGSGTRTLSYDGLQACYDHQRPVLGLLKFLVEAKLISEDDLDALFLVDAGGDEDLLPAAVLSGEILDDLRRAAAH